MAKHFYVLIFFLFAVLFFTNCAEKKISVATLVVNNTNYIENIKTTGTIEAVKTQFFKAPKIHYPMRVARLVEDGSFVKEGDTICIIDCPELTDKLEASENNLDIENANAKKLEADNALEISMLEAQIANNSTQMKIVALDSLQMKFAPEAKRRILELEFKKAQLEQKNLARKLISQKKINEAELRRSKSKIKQFENRINSSSDQKKQLSILAPKEGMVLYVESPIMFYMSSSGAGQVGGMIKEGNSVWQDMALLQMPDLSEMQIKIEVPEGDFKRIEVGQKVLITVDASNMLTTTGKVLKKAMVGKNIEYNSKIKNFDITISVDSCHLQMKPGISAQCEIIIKEFENKIIIPSIAIFDVDSSKVVYVETAKKFAPQKVEISYSNNSIAIISNGLKSGETIALMRPGSNELVNPLTNKTQPLKTDTTSDINTQFQNKTVNDKPIKK